ncbi:uncharacterized protein Z520_01655 [Fonsecaea multimorphosa CBS 102226]|uniref:Uncharacterized protein n=1 Tax=Fonsecaea multimorphosa CBS 102226 TaxID=1442371 RepID=A0A0D2KB06_9EURO|nr:uncharacterized protein Z520_01655 [Fonsecaea multimorphosa CBS 102226]KIY03188.1 hypothetical protein Z520_01655 [Fonsecaea multimorphosa CBS 102226]OAL30430.1 hypothetical protein AYO22_01628 [Fonsecaea multimorphosa]
MDSFQVYKPGASALTKRQQAILAIPTTYLGLNSGPKPGTVAAIVLGSVGGFLLIIYLIWAALNYGNVFGFNRRGVVEEEVIRRRRPRGTVVEETIEVDRRSSARRRGTSSMREVEEDVTVEE